MRLVFGTLPTIFKRDFMFFFTVQLVIFIKVIIFFSFFGHGLSYYGQPLAWDIPFAPLPIFGNMINVWDYFFHQAMHILIALWVFLLVKHLRQFHFNEWGFLFLIATIIHNAGYWLTSSHPSWLFSVRDFLIDYFSLWGFFLVFLLILKWFPSIKKWRIPYFDG